ncbi:MAG: AraC family transcriptional regulator [Pseudomonadota bacterium]
MEQNATQQAVSQVSRRILVVSRSTNDAVIAQALRYLADHFTDPSLSIQRLRAVLSARPKDFARRFRDAVGLNPFMYVLAKRVELASLLLQESDLPVADVAHASGFKSPAALSQIFRQHRGCSPTQFRRSVPALGSARRVDQIGALSTLPDDLLGAACARCRRPFPPLPALVVYREASPLCVLCAEHLNVSPQLVQAHVDAGGPEMTLLGVPSMGPPTGVRLHPRVQDYVLTALVECMGVLAPIPLDVWYATRRIA